MVQVWAGSKYDPGLVPNLPLDTGAKLKAAVDNSPETVCACVANSSSKAVQSIGMLKR